MGPRSDLYSLGLVLYRMLTGQVPKENDGGVLMILRRTTEPIPDVQAVCAQPLPVGMSDAIMRAIAPRPDDRWQDARSMRLALEAALEGAGVDVLANTSPGTSAMSPADGVTEEEPPTLVHDQAWRGSDGAGEED